MSGSEFEFKDAVKVLQEMTNLQCSDGNWNCDEYMHGMANGMIFALSLFQEKRPEYLEKPKNWISCDITRPVKSL